MDLAAAVDSAVTRVRFGAVHILLPRRLNRHIARLLLGVVLFAQAVMAVHACTPAQRLAGFSPAAVHAIHATGESCHQQASADTARCMTHCSTADQSADTHQIPVWAPPDVALLTVPLAADRVAGGSAALSASAVASGDPPISIRFQVFRI